MEKKYRKYEKTYNSTAHIQPKSYETEKQMAGVDDDNDNLSQSFPEHED